MIKLTLDYGKPVWLNPRYITRLEPRRDGKTEVWTSEPNVNGAVCWYLVKEAPEEVVACLDEKRK